MRSATRLSVSWDRSPCAPSPCPCRRCPPARPTPAPGATAAMTSARLRPALLSTATTGPISRQAAPRGQPSGMASASAVCFVNSHRSPLHGRGDRPVHAHGAGPGLPRAHSGRPADRRARAVPGARLRRARRDLSLGPRQPARTRGRRWPTGRTAHGARREAARRRDGTPPRQRRRRVIPRHVQERDVPPSQLRHPQGGATRISRVRRGIPRPPSPALHDRLPHP